MNRRTHRLLWIFGGILVIVAIGCAANSLRPGVSFAGQTGRVVHTPPYQPYIHVKR